MSKTPNLCYCGPGYICDEHPTAIKTLLDLVKDNEAPETIPVYFLGEKVGEAVSF